MARHMVLSHNCVPTGPEVKNAGDPYTFVSWTACKKVLPSQKSNGGWWIPGTCTFNATPLSLPSLRKDISGEQYFR